MNMCMNIGCLRVFIVDAQGKGLHCQLGGGPFAFRRRRGCLRCLPVGGENLAGGPAASLPILASGVPTVGRGLGYSTGYCYRHGVAGGVHLVGALSGPVARGGEDALCKISVVLERSDRHCSAGYWHAPFPPHWELSPPGAPARRQRKRFLLFRRGNSQSVPLKIEGTPYVGSTV